MKKIVLSLLCSAICVISFAQTTPTLKQVVNAGSIAYKAMFYNGNYHGAASTFWVPDKKYVDSIVPIISPKFDSTHCWTKLRTDSIEACSPLVLKASSVNTTSNVAIGGTITSGAIGTNVTAVTQSSFNNSTKVSTTAYVDAASTNGMRTNTLYAVDYGVVADGTTDNTGAFNTFMAACKAGNYKGVLPLGTILFNSKPNNIDFAWDLGGVGLNGTVLKRNYNESTATNGLLTIVAASGVKIHDMAIEAASGTTGGCMISVTSTSIFASSGIILENLWLSTFGSDTQTYSLYLDGSSKTSAPTGLRDVSLKNVHVFGSTNYSAFIKSVVGFTWLGGGVYPAGGTGSLSGGLAIAGVTSVKSQYVNIEIVTCNGVNLTNCTNINIISPVIGSISGVSVNNDNTCSYTSIKGSLSGTLVESWLNSECDNVGTKLSFNDGAVKITNIGGGTTPTNYLEIAGSTANNLNFPGIQFTGGTGVTTYASIGTNNSGQGFFIQGGTSTSHNQQGKLLFFNNNNVADANSYAEFSFNGTSRFRFQSDGLLGIGGVTAPVGVLQIASGSASTPALILNSQTSYTGTTDGSLWNDATQKCFAGYIGSTFKYPVTAVYTQTTAVTVASTTVNTSVLTSTVSAGDLAAAKSIRIKLLGFHSAVSNPNITITITLNGTTVLTTGAIASGSSTNAYCEINGIITIRTTGVGGTVSAQGLYQEDGGGVANVYAPMVNTSTVSVNTTTPTIDVKAQWGTASGSNTITFTDGIIEIVK